jgi:hypothetical protein
VHDIVIDTTVAPLTPERLISWRANAAEGSWLCYFTGFLDRSRSRDVALDKLASFVYRDLYLAGRAVLVQKRLENIEDGFGYWCVAVNDLKPVQERHEETRRR